MSDLIIVAAARTEGGKAVHMFPVGEELAPICGRLKGTVDAISETDDDVTCAACRSVYKKGNHTLDLGDVDAPEEQDEEEQDLEGAEDELDDISDEDEGEEDERSTSKAEKFAAFAAAHGWVTRIKTQHGQTNKGLLTFVYAEKGNVRIWMSWEEGRYQYNDSRIIKGKGEVLNAFIRNASAARGYVNAMSIQEDATKPVLLRSVKTG